MTARVFGFAGYSGSGKTSLIEKLIPALVAQQLIVSLIKHAHHDFDTDLPGKDSYRHRTAGCSEVLIGSSKRWGLVHELRGSAEPTLHAHLARLSPCDLVLVEGFKFADIPKMEIWRSVNQKPNLFDNDPRILAVASDVRVESRLPQFRLDEIGAIAGFVIERAEPCHV